MTAPNILTGRNINVFENFSVTPDGTLLITNGVDAASRWDGMTASAENAGIPQPSSAPTLTDDTAAGSVAASSTFNGAYRYIDDDLTFDENTDPNTVGTPGPQPGSLSALGAVTTGAGGSHRIDWTGLAASSDTRVVKLELWRTTAGQATTVYKVATLGTNGVVSTVTDAAGTNKVTTSASHNLLSNAVITIAGVTGGSNINGSRTVTVVDATSFTIGTAYSANGTGGTWTITGYSDEGNTDTQLQALSAMAIVNPDGSPNSRRFTVPPNFKAVSVPFQGRQWYLVNIEYTTGTVAVTNNSATVTGTGTAWTSQMAGRYFTKVGDTRQYLISAASATSLTLSEVYAGSTTSGSSYAVRVSPQEKNNAYYSEDSEWESVPTINTRRIDMGHLDDDDTGAMPYLSSLFVLQKRHIWRLNFNKQPNIDATISKAADRGCFNQRCWDVFEGVAYLMDATGPYRFTGGQPDYLAQPIQNLWRDGTVDFTKSDRFFVRVDPVQEVVRYHVVLTGDNDTSYPSSAVCLSTRQNKWWLENFAFGMGGSCAFELSGRLRVATAGINDGVFLAQQGLTDVVTAPVTGTATSATSTTLTDSTAAFATSIVGASVYIYAGTGKGQPIRYITIRNSGTQFTVNQAWATTPDSTSKYMVGGIPWIGKTGTYKFSEADVRNSNSVGVTFQPVTTEAAGTLDIRQYIDHRTSPENFQGTLPDTGQGVSTEDGKPDAVVNMYRDISTLDQASGHGRLTMAQHGNSPHFERYEAIELRGVQGTDAIQLYGLTIEGVQ